MAPDDPRQAIEAPVRRALVAIGARGPLPVGLTLVAVLCRTIPALGYLNGVIAIVVPVLLVVYACFVRIERRAALAHPGGE